jgi:uncharacterized protein (TIGR02271 family)
VRQPDGWSIRLPVRREEVRVEKRVVVYEEVDIRREPVEDVEHVHDTVLHEELHVQPRGDVERVPASRVRGGTNTWR